MSKGQTPIRCIDCPKDISDSIKYLSDKGARCEKCYLLTGKK